MLSHSPHGTEELAGKDVPAGQDESLEYKQEYDTIREHYLAIRESDAIVIVNKEKSGIQNYIGGNTFLEIGFAHVLGKPIFLLNPIPDMIYTTEIIAMNPIVINGDFSLIK